MRKAERSLRRTMSMLAREQMAKIIAARPVSPPELRARGRLRIRQSDAKPCPSCGTDVYPSSGASYVFFDEETRVSCRLNCRCGCPFDVWIDTDPAE